MRPAHRLVARPPAAARLVPCLMASALLAAIVHAEPEPPLPGRITLELQETNVAGPVPEALPMQGGASFSTSTQSMVWARRGSLGLGLGVAQPWQSPSRLQGAAPDDAGGPLGAPDDRRLVLGLALYTGASSRLVWQAQMTGETTTRLPGPALVLKRADPVRALARGALRMELSRNTTLTLRPRGRRISVALSSQW